MYALDLRGFGHSDRPGTHSFEPMRDDVAGLAETLDAPRYAVVGHSMGATIAWLLAQQHAERISHLVAVDSAPPKDAVVIDPGPRPSPEPPFDWEALTTVLAQLADPTLHGWAGISAPPPRP